MAFTVVKSASTFDENLTFGTVVVSCDEKNHSAAIEMLRGPEPRKMALAYARTKKVNDPSINDNISHPYPVNKEGLLLSEVTDKDGKPLPPTHPRRQPAEYRVDVPIAGRLV